MWKGVYNDVWFQLNNLTLTTVEMRNLKNIKVVEIIRSEHFTMLNCFDFKKT